MFTGRKVRKGEPLWLPEDVELALEWQQDQDEHCPRCNQRREFSEDPLRADEWKATALRCHGCASIAREADETAERGKAAGIDVHGMSYYVMHEGDGHGRPHRQSPPRSRSGPVEQGS